MLERVRFAISTAIFNATNSFRQLGTILYEKGVVETRQEITRLSASLWAWRDAASAGAIARQFRSLVAAVGTVFGLVFWILFSLPLLALWSLWWLVGKVCWLAWWIPWKLFEAFIRGPAWQKAAVIILLGASAWGAWLGLQYVRLRNHLQNQLAAIDEAVLKCDAATLRRLLEERLAENPNDADSGRRLTQLLAGSAQPTDAPMARLLMISHLNTGEIAAAEREARKLLENRPGHVLAHVIIAGAAIRRPVSGVFTSRLQAARNRREARRQLSAAPTLNNSTEDLFPVGLLYGAEVALESRHFPKLSEFLNFILGRFVSSGERTASLFSRREVGTLLEFYVNALAGPGSDVRLLDHWSDVVRVCRLSTDADDAPVEELVRIAQLEEILLHLLATRFVPAGRIDKEVAAQSASRLEEHLRLVWERVRNARPDAPEGWLGEAARLVRSGRLTEATAFLDAGARGTTSKELRERLTQAKVLLLARNQRDGAVDAAVAAMQETPGSVSLQQLAASSAFAAGRWQQVVDICRSVNPGRSERWAISLEAAACIKLRRFEEALSAIAPVREELLKTARGVDLLTSALAGAGKWNEVDALLEGLESDRAAGPRRDQLILAASIAMGNIGHPGRAVPALEKVVARNPDAVMPRMALAEALGMASQTSLLSWNTALARRAVDEYEWLLRRRSDDLVAVNAVVWLRMNALGDVDGAWSASEPLRKLENRPDAPIPLLDTLGVLYLRRGKLAAARDLLQRIVDTGRAECRHYCHLAEAMMAVEWNAEARIQLDRAKELVRTPGDQSLLDAMLLRLKQKTERSP